VPVAYDAIEKRRLQAMARNENSGKRDKVGEVGKVGEVEKVTNCFWRESINGKSIFGSYDEGIAGNAQER
jgi:hypothetical protein